jgi:phage terminase large subunit-like protein
MIVAERKRPKSKRRAVRQTKAARCRATRAPAKSESPAAANVPAKWRKLFDLLPGGYDPIATAAPGQWFCPDEAERVVRFFHEHCTHIEGTLAGRPFHLEPWQQAVVGCLFGWLNADCTRRYRKLLLYVPRKNGKSPFAAGIALYVLFCDGEIGADIPLAASTGKQAGIVFRHCDRMVGNSPEMRGMAKIFRGMGQRSIAFEAQQSCVKVIASDADGEHGGNGYAAIVDELHAHKKRDLCDVIETSMASANRRHTLIVYITTADYDRPSICNEVYDYACAVRDGAFDDPTFMPVIYAADVKDDWKDERVWERSNPNLDVSVSRKYLREACRKAELVPGFLNTFLRLHLNVRTEQQDRWLDMDVWKACGVKPPAAKAWRARALKRFAGQQCVGGLDLGATSDLTVLVLMFGGFADGFTLIPWLWMPKENVARKTPAVRELYANWIRSGWIITTEGSVTDYRVVRRDINALAEQFGIIELAIDRTFQGAQLCNELLDDGMAMLPFSQSFGSMTAPCKEFSELLIAQKIDHGGHPVLSWMAANAVLKTNDSGQMKTAKPDKTSNLKVDGIVCSVMCVGSAQRRREEQRGNVYSEGVGV